jgi:molybdate transport system substrate-binding protein
VRDYSAGPRILESATRLLQVHDTRDLNAAKLSGGDAVRIKQGTLIGMALAAFLATASQAADIKVISANAMREVIAEARADFEAKTGNRVTIVVVETGEIRRRIMGGEAFDVAIVPRDVSDEFEKAGKIGPGSAVSLTRVNFGLAVPTDSPRPDVSTPDALKRTLLAARTVLITDPATGGVSGVHFMEVVNKLGIAEEMKDNIVANPGGAVLAKRVVQGEADLAAAAESEIRCVKGATFLPYPAVFQRTIIFRGGVGTATKNASAANAYLSFMTGSEAANAYSAHCLTRG